MTESPPLAEPLVLLRLVTAGTAVVESEPSPPFPDEPEPSPEPLPLPEPTNVNWSADDVGEVPDLVVTVTSTVPAAWAVATAVIDV